MVECRYAFREFSILDDRGNIDGLLDVDTRSLLKDNNVTENSVVVDDIHRGKIQSVKGISIRSGSRFDRDTELAEIDRITDIVSSTPID